MALVRWSPAVETDRTSDLSRVFDAFFGAGSGAATRRWVPAMDLVESEDAFVLKADLPGLDRDDVTIEITDRMLTVSGERKSEHTAEGEGYHRVERSFGSFSRSLTLPAGVDAESVAASFEKGVLEVRIPKPREAKPHRVAIGPAALEGDATESE